MIFVRDIKSDSFEWNSNVYISQKKFYQLTAHNVHPGDILATKMGLPPCISCIYPKWLAEGVITADIIRLRPDHLVVDVRWLSKAMNAHSVQRQVQAITAGVTRPKVTLGSFRSLKLACPILKEQRLIANKIDNLSFIIEKNQGQLRKTKVIKSGLMQDLLTGNVRVKVDEADEASAHG